MPTSTDPDSVFSPIRYTGASLELLDQTRLPREETWLSCATVEPIAEAIRRLSVRGAPAIGVTAAFGLVVGLRGTPTGELAARFDDVSELLLATRPTAVNLRWAVERGRDVFERAMADDPGTALATLESWAVELHRRDIETNRTMAEHGAARFEPGDRVLTHCNTGALATAGIGTALGVIDAAHRRHGLDRVWVDETRPLLQGARLTTWELERLGVPYRLVTDSSVGILMSRGLVDRVVVGADRIAANGDAANKIGTYTVAVLAHRHGVPFYVAAPTSTIDPRAASGDEIPIEERSSREVTEVFGTEIAPGATEAVNFAFDVTPAELIAGIATEQGVLEPPYGPSIAAALARAAADTDER